MSWLEAAVQPWFVQRRDPWRKNFGNLFVLRQYQKLWPNLDSTLIRRAFSLWPVCNHKRGSATKPFVHLDHSGHLSQIQTWFRSCLMQTSAKSRSGFFRRPSANNKTEHLCSNQIAHTHTHPTHRSVHDVMDRSFSPTLICSATRSSATNYWKLVCAKTVSEFVAQPWFNLDSTSLFTLACLQS